MDWEAQARAVATALKILDAHGELRLLASLELLDFVVELEQSTGLEIPSTRASQERFASVRSVGELLRQLATEQGRP